jgi:S1-C subfamily serine protease
MKVLAYISTLVFVAPFASAQTTLLEFSGQHCPPCRQMQPVVAALEREGYHIERINTELAENRAKVNQFRVNQIPTFVAIRDGREIDRIVGAVPAERLKSMLGQPAQARNSKPKSPTAKSSKAPEKTAVSVSHPTKPSDRTLIDCSVRIVVDDAKSRSFGTGTVVRSVPGETLILTCAHLFNGVSRQATTTVEFFGLPNRTKLGGEVLARDNEADLCLLRVTSQQAVPFARVAGKSSNVKSGQAASSVGCDNGSDPTVRQMRVTAINRYVGAPTIECSGEPVEGRSGGGLFNEHGEVIGVCSARDPADHRGIYGGLAAIHSLLDRNKLASLYEPKPATESPIILASHGNDGAQPVTLPSPAAMGLNVDRNLPVPEGAEFAEVVCVIRSLNDPKAPAKVVLINRASPEFLSLLEKEQASQSGPSSTSMRLPAHTGKPSMNEKPQNPSSSHTASVDQSGWHSSKSTEPGTGNSAPRESRSETLESARWQKNWTPGAAGPDAPVRR